MLHSQYYPPPRSQKILLARVARRVNTLDAIRQVTKPAVAVAYLAWSRRPKLCP